MLGRVIAAALIAGVAAMPVTAPRVAADDVPPVQVPGARVVDLRDTNGGLARYITIPSSSAFRTYGGRGSSCRYVLPAGGTTSDGQTVLPGQAVESTHWLFVEGLPESMGEPTPDDPATTNGPLETAVRWFTVFCDTVHHAVGIVAVPARDSFFDPHRRLDTLYQRLHLVRPVVFRNPVVDRWGGLITRYQSWLAIVPTAWQAQRSDPVRWRGWTMYLLVTPVAMDFRVDTTPDAARPSPVFHGVVPCVARGTTATAGGGALPAMPWLPAQSTPGANGNCRWTPAGPGSVTVEARVTFRVTFWANGYTEALPDYVWTSLPTTFRLGELSVVNTDR